ncbi:hypothetical protein JAO71_12550 [Olleya sp. YSTF-M6]|uniref:Uncharacterized protein n=1 Tax=Olleya sediminilitoris TaxID=2795739 RepID=A0ABS1WNE8_9FLAO|nr:MULTISPECIES: hypothetical protein [Olleya]MBL7560630.1 hypothetical protein [Olleya sediminilitoris]
MKPNKILLLITLICVTPLIIMSTNNDVQIVSKLKPISDNSINSQNTAYNNSTDLKIGDSYFDIKVKVPHFKINNKTKNVSINSPSNIYILDQTAHKDLTKYTIANTVKIIDIITKK